jgi:hypothetical protein
MIQTYAIVKDNQILAVYETADGLSGVIAAARNEGIHDGEPMELPIGFAGVVGSDLREYAPDGHLRPLEERIAEGLVVIPERYVFKEGRIQRKTDFELMRDKIEPVPEGMKLVEDEDFHLEMMTVREQVESGQITAESGLVIMSANERARRNSLLSESDWTQVADTPLNQDERDAWAIYRQTLRDITNQQGFPWEITWPVRPDGVQA